MEKEEKLILSLGVFGATADYVTTEVGLRIPEISEMNPIANPVIEGAFAVGGSLLAGELGRRLGVGRNLRLLMMFVPASIPLIGAIRNLTLIAAVNARAYRISEFPLLYW
jgi:hypothetical protein